MLGPCHPSGEAGLSVSPISQRTRFLAEAVRLLGTPYQWGGKGGPRDWGLDCSGLVTVALHAAGGPDWRQSHNSQALYDALPPPRYQVLRGGELVFYGSGPKAVTHVMVHLGGELLAGACGGGHDCITLEEARRLAAKVQTRMGLHYRPDFVGVRDIRFQDES